MMDPKSKCCNVKSMCGLNLWQGVIFVGTSTIMVCSLIFIISVVSLSQILSTESQYNKNPVLAVNMLFVLYSSSISSYQIVISAFLIWHVLKQHFKNHVFFCSLWYVSHLSILTLYCFLFSARTIITFNARYYLSAIITIVCAVAYKGTFIYFSVVVNSYLHSLNVERYV